MSHTTFYMPLSKKAVLQNIQRNITAGYVRYIKGEISIDKLLGFIDKFADKFGIHLNQIQRNANKRKGIANTRLFIYPKEGNYSINPMVFEWVLLATPGQIKDEKQFKDLNNKKTKLTFLNLDWWYHYHGKKQKQVWTWFYTKSKFQSMRSYLLDCINNQFTAKTVSEINYFLNNLRIEAGFNGMNEQQFQLQMILRKGLSDKVQGQIQYFKAYRNKGFLRTSGADVTISSIQLLERFKSNSQVSFVDALPDEIGIQHEYEAENKEL